LSYTDYRKETEKGKIEETWETGAHPENSCAEPKHLGSTELAAGKGQQLWIPEIMPCPRCMVKINSSEFSDF
jgi:hypothetical protein